MLYQHLETLTENFFAPLVYYLITLHYWKFILFLFVTLVQFLWPLILTFLASSPCIINLMPCRWLQLITKKTPAKTHSSITSELQAVPFLIFSSQRIYFPIQKALTAFSVDNQTLILGIISFCHGEKYLQYKFFLILSYKIFKYLTVWMSCSNLYT